jgi:hypothetical protein
MASQDFPQHLCRLLECHDESRRKTHKWSKLSIVAVKHDDPGDDSSDDSCDDSQLGIVVESAVYSDRSQIDYWDDPTIQKIGRFK